jgi:hypothetical protein
MNDKVKKMYDKDIDKVSGGRDGDYGFVGTYPCPYCGWTNTLNDYFFSGQSSRSCEKCGKSFVIRF